MGALSDRVLSSPDETNAIGRALGLALHDGDFVGLIGSLGAGKTLFTRAVAEALGIPTEDVTSPTYALLQRYHGRLTLHHADLYRLESEPQLAAIGYFELLEEPGVFLVEWVDRIAQAAPADALLVELSNQGETQRRLSVRATGERSAALLERWVQLTAPSEGTE